MGAVPIFRRKKLRAKRVKNKGGRPPGRKEPSRVSRHSMIFNFARFLRLLNQEGRKERDGGEQD